MRGDCGSVGKQCNSSVLVFREGDVKGKKSEKEERERGGGGDVAGDGGRGDPVEHAGLGRDDLGSGGLISELELLLIGETTKKEKKRRKGGGKHVDGLVSSAKISLGNIRYKNIEEVVQTFQAR